MPPEKILSIKHFFIVCFGGKYKTPDNSKYRGWTLYYHGTVWTFLSHAKHSISHKFEIAKLDIAIWIIKTFNLNK